MILYATQVRNYSWCAKRNWNSNLLHYFVTRESNVITVMQQHWSGNDEFLMSIGYSVCFEYFGLVTLSSQLRSPPLRLVLKCVLLAPLGTQFCSHDLFLRFSQFSKRKSQPSSHQISDQLNKWNHINPATLTKSF